MCVVVNVMVTLHSIPADRSVCMQLEPHQARTEQICTELSCTAQHTGRQERGGRKFAVCDILQTKPAAAAVTS